MFEVNSADERSSKYSIINYGLHQPTRAILTLKPQILNYAKAFPSDK